MSQAPATGICMHQLVETNLKGNIKSPQYLPFVMKIPSQKLNAERRNDIAMKIVHIRWTESVQIWQAANVTLFRPHNRYTLADKPDKCDVNWKINITRKKHRSHKNTDSWEDGLKIKIKISVVVFAYTYFNEIPYNYKWITMPMIMIVQILTNEFTNITHAIYMPIM